MAVKEQTEIDGFRVEVETMTDDNDAARGEWVDCWISKGRHSASLALAEDCGVIEVDGGEDIPIPAKTLERVRAYAVSLGYD
jgi:hypothetical protein